MASGFNFGGFLEGLKSSGVIEQIAVWGMLSPLFSAILAPFMTLLTAEMQAAFPVLPTSPADLANLVNRGFMGKDQATAAARRSGVSPPDFEDLVNLAGQSLPPQALAEALRRGIIPADHKEPNTPSFAGGVRQGNLRDLWIPTLKALSLANPSPSDALDALLEGQVDAAKAKELYALFGGNPEYFQLMFDTRGSAPTPTEAAVMANRGIIPWTGKGPQVVSYEQAFLEGPWRNKWLKPYQQLSQYYPPPRTITAMVKEGSLTQAQGLKYLIDQGLSQTLAQAYVVSASAQKVAKAKELAETTVLALVQDQLITNAVAVQMLGALGYDQHEAAFILEVESMRITQQATSSAVSKVRTLYIDRKIDQNTALSALQRLTVPADQVQNLLTIWDLERTANVRVLTAAE